MNNFHISRDIAVQAFKELGGDQASVSESWLIKKGYVVGRRLKCGSLIAVCFFEADEVKVYGEDGKVLKVVAFSEMGKAA